MGSEDPVVAHEIDAGARGEGSELFEELEGLEEEVTCAVGPLPLQLQQDASVAGELEAILGDGRPQQVAAELFESRARVRPRSEGREEHRLLRTARRARAGTRSSYAQRLPSLDRRCPVIPCVSAKN